MAKTKQKNKQKRKLICEQIVTAYSPPDRFRLPPYIETGAQHLVSGYYYYFHYYYRLHHFASYLLNSVGYYLKDYWTYYCCRWTIDGDCYSNRY